MNSVCSIPVQIRLVLATRNVGNYLSSRKLWEGEFPCRAVCRLITFCYKLCICLNILLEKWINWISLLTIIYSRLFLFFLSNDRKCSLQQDSYSLLVLCLLERVPACESALLSYILTFLSFSRRILPRAIYSRLWDLFKILLKRLIGFGDLA